MKELPKNSDLMRLPPERIARFAGRCAERVQSFLLLAPSPNRDKLQQAFITTTSIASENASQLGKALNDSLGSIVGIKERDSWLFAAATVCNAARARLFAVLLSEGNSSSIVQVEHLARTAALAAQSCIQTLRDAKISEDTINYVGELIASDYEKLCAAPVQEQSVVNLNAHLGNLWPAGIPSGFPR